MLFLRVYEPGKILFLPTAQTLDLGSHHLQTRCPFPWVPSPSTHTLHAAKASDKGADATCTVRPPKNQKENSSLKDVKQTSY